MCNGQRGHEIQFQTGYFLNWGIIFYDYNESESRRHNYEFDHVYDADLLSISWHYPVNAYLDLGVNFTKSYDASSELVQAESTLFDSELGGGPQDAELFAGQTDIESHYLSFGVDIRINHLIKSNKYKFYFILSPGYQILENLLKDLDFIETDPVLKQVLLDDFVRKEKHMNVGIGFGVSYPLKSGINLKILELYDRFTMNVNASNLLSQGHSLEIRTGIAYQFYRRK